MTSTDCNPSPDPDSRPEDPRLAPYWHAMEEARPTLIRVARGSGFDPTLCEWLVDEVLERLSECYLQENPPRDVFAWCRSVLRRCLGEIRKLPSTRLLKGDPVDDRARRTPMAIPGTLEFWTWLGVHRHILKPLCSPLEWKAVLHTRNARTVAQAARSCGQTERDYRNLLKRAGGKFFSALLRNLVLQCH